VHGKGTTSILGSFKFLISYGESLGIESKTPEGGMDEKGEGKLLEVSGANPRGDKDQVEASLLCIDTGVLQWRDG
jgi:hypothetical protein